MQFMRKITPERGDVGFLSDLMSQAIADVPVSRTVVLHDERISVRLEASIWDGLIDIGERRSKSVDELCGEIDARRDGIPLSTAIRVYVLQYFRDMTESA